MKNHQHRVFATYKTTDNKDFYSSDEVLSNIELIKTTCPLLSYDEMKKSQKRQWFNNICTLYPLVIFILENKSSENIVFISQTNSYLLNLYGSTSTLHDAIVNLEERCRIISNIGLEYIIGKRPFGYYVSQENLNTFLAIYNNECVPKILCSKPKDESKYWYRKFRLNSNMQIEYQGYTLEEIYDGINKNYPQIPYYSKLVDELNQIIEEPSEKIKFIPRLHFSAKGKITKIGIRATCDIANYTSIENKLKDNPNFVADPQVKYREHYLVSRLGENYEEFDINASVPRVIVAMGFGGDMGDLKKDFYRLLFEQFIDDYTMYFNPSVTDWCQETRSFFKNKFMRLMFGGTPSEIVESILEEEKIVDFDDIENKQKPFTTLKNKGVDILALIEKWKYYSLSLLGPMENREYKRYDTSVFLHESCIYLELRKILACRGIRVIQVYDGFYFKEGETPSDIEKLVQESAKKYYEIKEELLYQSIINN